MLKYIALACVILTKIVENARIAEKLVRMNRCFVTFILLVVISGSESANCINSQNGGAYPFLDKSLRVYVFYKKGKELCGMQFR